MATLAGLTDDTAESITLKFTSGSLTPAVSSTVVVNPAVDLTVRSFTASPDPVVAGANLTYTSVVTNNGPSPATFVTLTSPLGATVSYVSATTTQGTVGLQGSVVVANLGALAVGALGHGELRGHSEWGWSGHGFGQRHRGRDGYQHVQQLGHRVDHRDRSRGNHRVQLGELRRARERRLGRPSP